MKLQFKLGLACAGVLTAVSLLAGCPNGVPGISPSTGPGSSLQGRLTFALNQGSNPGMPLTVRLKTRPTGTTTNFSGAPQTTQTDNSGNFSFAGLPAADYQVEYDDEGKVAASTFNTTGVAVSDPVTVSASQSAAPQVSMELAWDFTQATPTPSSTASSRTVTFSWPPKPGVSNANYQVTVFNTASTGAGALRSSTAGTGTTASLDLTNDANGSPITAGTHYYVVKYWRADGSFGGANFYGQTKPIPLVLP